MALSARFQEGNLICLDDFVMERIKTKDFVSVMQSLAAPNALIVAPDERYNLSLSARNVPGYKVMRPEGLNVYDILLHKKVVLLQDTIGGVEERYSA